MTKINVGLVGLGEIAQIIHLPILQAHSDKFEIAAICDISQELLTAMGERYNVPADHRYTDYHDLARQGDLGAVFVLNSDEYHTDSALAAIRQGKHVLIEKPMCLARQEAEAIIKARDEAGVRSWLPTCVASLPPSSRPLSTCALLRRSTMPGCAILSDRTRSS